MIKVYSAALLLLFSVSATANKVIIHKNSGIPAAGVVVYLTDHNKAISANTTYLSKPSAANTVISQQDKKFNPYLSMVSSQNNVTFNNDDDITHHIYAIDAEQSFDFKLRSGDPAKTIKFSKPGKIAMGCNIHDWMTGHLLVVDTPYYGITDANGSFDLSNVPAGSYTLALFHPQLHQQDNNKLVELNLPLSNQQLITLQQSMYETPKQQSLDDFEFVEDY